MKEIEKIGNRDWIEVKNYWQNFISTPEFPITNFQYNDSLDDKLNTVSDNIKATEKKTTIRDHFEILNGIQEKIFMESIFLLYKSINSLKSAQSCQYAGYKTWSMSNYYQSCFFSLKSILNLLGVHYTRTKNNNDIIIDLIPSYKRINKSELTQKRKVFECRIIITKQLKHYEQWSIFQKAVTYTKNLDLTEFLCSAIRKLKPKDFAETRNNIIYHNLYWLFPDLKSEIIDMDFGLINLDISKIEEQIYNKSFIVILSYLLFDYCISLFSQLSTVSNNFKQEFDIFYNSIIHENNRNFASFVNLNSDICSSNTIFHQNYK